MKCPDPSWEDDCLGSHKFDKEGFCIFCGNKEEAMTHKEKAREYKEKINQWLRLVLTSYRRHWETEGKEKPKAAELAATGELFDAAVQEISGILASTEKKGREEGLLASKRYDNGFVEGWNEAIEAAAKVVEDEAKHTGFTDHLFVDVKALIERIRRM